MDEASGGRVRAIKQAVANEVPDGAHALEIGCGTGELARMLATRGCQVEGFDLSPTMIEVARERAISDGLEEQVELREAGVESMDSFEEESFDAVVSTRVFSELTGDERAYALRHTHRVLRRGGRLILADEVEPRGAGRRAVYALVRAPAVVATYFVSGSTTHALQDPSGEIVRAGLVVDSETRSHGDAFAILVGHRPEEAHGH